MINTKKKREKSIILEINLSRIAINVRLYVLYTYDINYKREILNNDKSFKSFNSTRKYNNSNIA